MWMPWRERGLAQKTLRQYTGALRWCLRYLGVAERTMFGIPHVKNVQPRGNTIGKDALERLLGNAPQHMRMYILLCSDLAMRAGAAVKLSENDWDNDEGAFRFKTKSGIIVHLPLTKRVRAMVDIAHSYRCADSATPYVTRLGGPDVRYMYHSYGRQLKLMLAELGIDKITTHDLRRSAARRMYTSTKDLQVVQALLGHTNIASTFNYLYPHTGKVTAEQLEAAANDRR